MIVRMSRPWRHPDTGLLYYRSRLPSDLSAMGGSTMTIEIGGTTSAVKLGSHVKVSLRTRDVAEARLRHAAVQAQLEQQFIAARSGTVSLPHKQIVALAGIWYRDLVAAHNDDPGDGEAWETYCSLLAEGLEYFDAHGDGVEHEPRSPKQGVRFLSGMGIHVDQFLDARGLNVDDATRTKLIEQVALALSWASITLIRRSRGDYGPDKIVARYPAWEPARAGKDITGTRLSELFEAWAKESQPQQSTIDQWRVCVQSFIEYIGHDDAANVRREDVVAWKQHLIDLKNAPKTINGSKLAALKAVLRWAVDNGFLPVNPVAGVSVRQNKKAGQRMLGFEKHEAAAILQAAARQSSAAYRWVPLLCAQSGARVAEVCQLRAEDIGTDDGIWYMSFRAEAGSLKNENSERRVPLHRYVIASGFLDFVKSKKGPLFYDPTRGKKDPKKPRPKIVAKNVANWVHSLGLDGIGRHARKDPNHAWRHLFRTLARDVGVPESVSLAITGHAAASVGQAYGETWLTTSSRAIERIPLEAIASGIVPQVGAVGATSAMSTE